MVAGNGTVSLFRDSKGRLLVCVNDDRNVGSPGVFYGESPLDYVLPATLCQLFVIILTSRSLYYLLRPIRTPKFICNVVGGILLGPSFLGRNKAYWDALFPVRQTDILMLGSLSGAAYLVFFNVVKMDVRMSLRAAKTTWRFGIFPTLASVLVIAALLNLVYIPQHAPHLDETAAGFISSILSFSFFPVISEALGELNLIATELGQIALSSAMTNDVLEWVNIAYVRIVVVGGNSVAYSVYTLISYLLFLAFSLYIIRPAMKSIARNTPIGKPVKEIFVVLILLGVLVMAGITDAIGLSFIMGPLVLGLVIPSGPPLGTVLVDKCGVIISEFLMPFFFVDIGLNADFSSFKGWREVVAFQCIVLAGYLAKMLACVLVGMTYNIMPKHGLVIGLMMCINGVVELIACTRMKKMGVLDLPTYSQLVLFVVEITAIVTPLAELLYKHRPRAASASSVHKGQTRTIHDTPKNSEFRVITCVHNEGNVRGIIALLEACNPAIESPIWAYAVHLIELLGKSAPILLPISYKQNKFLSVNYPSTNHIMRAFENYSNNSSGPVTVLPYVNVAPYKSMHEAVCNLAEDKLVPLIIMPFHENDRIEVDGHMAESIRKLNTRFQDRAPCTIGILVDRHSRLGASDHSKFCFHVGVFFIGGQDDREALALGIRMSEKPNTTVSLFRFMFTDKKCGGAEIEKEFLTRVEVEEEEASEMLDESLVEEFKSRKFGSGKVSWCEIMVDDGIELLGAIRELEGDYDLVMVGRRHDIGSLKDEEMANFIENTKTLGIFGDMLSSTEFCIGMVPVLVTQCGGGKPTNQLDRIGSVTTSIKSSVLL